MIANAADLDSYANIHLIAQMADAASAPVVKASGSAGESRVLSAQEAMSLIAEASADIRHYQAFFDGMADYFPVADLSVFSESDAKVFAEKYAAVAEFLSSYLKHLKVLFITAECTPTWKPHVGILRAYAKQSTRSFAAIRNIYEDTARVLRQVYIHKPVEVNLNVDEDSIKSLTEASHKKFGMSPPRWS